MDYLADTVALVRHLRGGCKIGARARQILREADAMAKEIPEFETDEETAKFWDEHDSSEYMEDAEWGQFEWLSAEDRCEFTNDEASFGKLWWKNGEQGG